MPLNRWVAWLMPALMAASTMEAAASVCPAATTTPAQAAASITSRAPGSSGAMVIMRSQPREASSSRENAVTSGRAR